MTRQLVVDRDIGKASYQFYENPILDGRGILRPFSLSGLKLLENTDEFKGLKNNPVKMQKDVLSKYKYLEIFDDCVFWLCNGWGPKGINDENFQIISAENKEDWPFAIGIADKLNLPFLTLGENPYLIAPKTGKVLNISEVENAKICHYTNTANLGLQNLHLNPLRGKITKVYSLLDLADMPRGNIKGLDIPLISFFRIDEEWAEDYDLKNARIIQTYLKDPVSWTIQYLHEHGPETLKQYLDGSWDKDDRLIKFMGQNQKRLGREGLWGKIIDYSNELGTYTTHDGRFEGNLIGALRETLRTQ